MKVHKSFTWHGWLTARRGSQFQNPKSDPIQPISSKGFPPSDGWLKWIPTLTQSSPEPVSNWTSVALGLLGGWKTCYRSYPINRHGKSQYITYWFPRFFFWHPILTSFNICELETANEMDPTRSHIWIQVLWASRYVSQKTQPAEWHILYIIHLQRVPKNKNSLLIHRIPFLSVDNPLWNP